MKKTGYQFCLLFLLMLLFLHQKIIAQASTSAQSSAMQTLLEAKHYTFTAQYAQPLSGRQVNLTTLYTLTITKDSLICDLPYFGEAYVAPLNPADNDLHFISNHFDYTVMPAKKGRYIVVIKPKDRTAISQLYLSVSQKGYASLQVIPNNKEAISYYGLVEETVRAKK